MRLLFIGTLVLTGAAGCASEAAPEAIDRTRVLELVGQLGSDNHDVREAATQKLIDCGEKVLPLIRELRSQPAEVEVSSRLDHVTRRLSPGGILWQVNIGSPDPVLTRDAIFFCGPDNKLHCVRTSDGKDAWTVPWKYNECSCLIFGMINGNPLLVTDDGQVKILSRADGNLLWDYKPRIISDFLNGMHFCPGCVLFNGGTAKQVLTCVNATDGHERWTAEFDSGLDDNAQYFPDFTTVNENQAVMSIGPAVGARNTVLFGIDLKTGKSLWRYNCNGDCRGLRASGGKLYFCSIVNKTDTLHCLNGADGKECWKFTPPAGDGFGLGLPGTWFREASSTPSADWNSMAPHWNTGFKDEADEAVSANLGGDKTLYTFRAADGALLWERTSADPIVSIRVCRTAGIVLLERYAKKDHINKLCALQRTDGKVLWEFESHPIEGTQSDDIQVSSPSVGVFTDAALVVVQAGDGKYYTLDLHDGKKLSEQQVHDAWSLYWIEHGLFYSRDGFGDNSNLLRIRGSTFELRKDPSFLTRPPE